MSISRVILAALLVTPLAASAAEPEDRGAADAAKVDLKAQILVAIQLPALAHHMREAGVPEIEVSGALIALREDKVDAGEAAETLVAADEAIRERGPIEKFGTFVKGELKSGKRGKKLAKAIKAEHKKRGIGKGKKLAQWKDPRGKHKGHGDPDAGHEPPGKAKGHDKGDGGPPSGAPPGKAKGHDRPGGDPPGKAKGHDKPKDPPGKAKGHDKPKDPPGKAKGHDKAKGHGPDKAKGHDKPHGGPPPHAKDKSKDKDKDKGKSNGKGNAKGKGK